MTVEKALSTDLALRTPTAFDDVAIALPSKRAAPSLTTLMENLNGMAYRCRNDRESTMLFVSEGCRRLTGYPPSALIDNRTAAYAELVHPEDQARFQQARRRALVRREVFRVDYRIISLSGDVRWVHEDGCGVFGKSDCAGILEGFITDVTEEKQAAREVHLLSEALKSIGDAVAITDLEKRILFANHAFLETYGYSAEEVEGMRVDRMQVDDECTERLEVIARKTLGGGWKGEVVNQRKDGTRFPVLLTTSAVNGEDGKPVALIGVAKDLSEERKLQSQLRQAQRMEAVGRLAGGVAHDFNNLLTVISGYSEMLLEILDPLDPWYQAIQQIAKAGHRAGSLTQQLLAFSRKQVIQPRILNLNQQIAETEKMLGRMIGEDIRLTTSLKPDLGLVKADPNQIDQVLLNLAVNARDAMPQGGELAVETANLDIDEAFQAVHPGATTGPHVMLAITDTGAGMDAATQEQIFEPFFTSKKQRQGSGLGLATVYGIVKQNRGYIWVYSEPGHGTCFKICFPRIEARSSGLSRPVGATTVHGGCETVLLVEDETGVRDLTARLLESNGYRVLQAGSADEAIALIETHPEVLPLLITDVVLPGMSGHHLAQRLRTTTPELAVIYMSGYTDETIAHHGILEEDVSFLQKPYTSKALLHLVRRVLDERSPAVSGSRFRDDAVDPCGGETVAVAAGCDPGVDHATG